MAIKKAVEFLWEFALILGVPSLTNASPASPEGAAELHVKPLYSVAALAPGESTTVTQSNFRVKRFQPASCIVSCEMPINRFCIYVSVCFPNGNLLFEYFQVSYAAIQTLPCQR
jgi:hypothetical protein